LRRGDKHGLTSKLKPTEVDDLVTYLARSSCSASSTSCSSSAASTRERDAAVDRKLRGCRSARCLTNIPLSSGAGAALLGELSRLLAARFEKPERWVMTSLQPGLAMTFGGTDAPRPSWPSRTWER